jgi:spore maturation protein CgeB
MRILFVASLHHPDLLREAHRDAPSGPDPLFPPSQAHHFWVRALRDLKHECEVFWRSDGAWPWSRRRALRMTRRMSWGRAAAAVAATMPALNPDFRLRNRRLIRHARAFQPDVVLLVGDNEVILPDTLAALKREHGLTLVYASGTSPVVFSRRIERVAAPLYDLVVTNDLYHAIQWRELGARRADVLPLSAIDPAFHHPYPLTADERARYACEVGFVGTLVPDVLYRERIEALEALRGFDLAVWSVHEVPASLRPFHRGPLLGEAMLRAAGAAAVAINPHGDFMRYGGNMRLFELCGVGAFQLTDDRPGVRQWFEPGTHLVTYRDTDDLRRLVGHYLTHETERRAIAEAGRAHVWAHHTYHQRMQRLVALVHEVRDG